MNNNFINKMRDLYGYKTVEKDTYINIDGSRTFLFDDEFILKLEKFLIGDINYELSKSDRQNIQNFIDFAVQNLENLTQEEQTKLQELDKYLGSL